MSVSTDWIIIIQITRIHRRRESLSYEIITYSLDPLQDRVHIIQPISKLSIKLNSYRLVGSVYPQGSKTFSHAYGPRRIRGSGTCDCVVTHASSFVYNPFRNWEPVELL